MRDSMAGSRLVGAALLVGALSCGDGKGDSGTPAPDAPPDGFDRQALLSSLSEHVFVPATTRFAHRADALVNKVELACGGTEVARDDAQEAWKQAMDAWQSIESLHIGPVAMDAGSLRYRVYSWPVVSSCAVDQEVMARHREPAGYDITGKRDNARGLDALEYLLFTETLEHSCPAQVAPQGWDALSEEQRETARCQYASLAAADVQAAAAELETAWSRDGVDFASRLAASGVSETGAFESAQEALNAVSDAMFFLDRTVKDMKLAEPAGIMPGRCAEPGAPCPSELELGFSAYSKEAIVANLTAFQALFLGGSPDEEHTGFDDWLRHAGADDLAADMTSRIAAAIDSVQAIPGTLGQAISANPTEVRAAYDAIKRVTDLLKTQFLTVLGLDFPDNAAADND